MYIYILYIYITFCNCKWWVSHHQSDHCLSWQLGALRCFTNLGFGLKKASCVKTYQLVYPLVMTNIAIENGHFLLNYQRVHEFGCQIHQRLFWDSTHVQGMKTLMTLAWSQIWIDMVLYVLSSENGLPTNNSDKNGKKKKRHNAPQFPLPLPIHPPTPQVFNGEVSYLDDPLPPETSSAWLLWWNPL